MISILNILSISSQVILIEIFEYIRFWATHFFSRVVQCESPWKTRKLDVICSNGGSLLTWRWSGVKGDSLIVNPQLAYLFPWLQIQRFYTVLRQRQWNKCAWYLTSPRTFQNYKKIEDFSLYNANLELIQHSEITQKCLKYWNYFCQKIKKSATILYWYCDLAMFCWKNETVSCRKPPTSFVFIHKKLISLQ